MPAFTPNLNQKSLPAQTDLVLLNLRANEIAARARFVLFRDEAKKTSSIAVSRLSLRAARHHMDCLSAIRLYELEAYRIENRSTPVQKAGAL